MTSRAAVVYAHKNETIDVITSKITYFTYSIQPLRHIYYIQPIIRYCVIFKYDIEIKEIHKMRNKREIRNKRTGKQSKRIRNIAIYRVCGYSSGGLLTSRFVVLKLPGAMRL